jgi:hypothetical protein
MCRVLAAVFTLSLVAVSQAGAADLVNERVTVAKAVDRTCFTKLLSGSTGVAKRDFTVPATGQLNARLTGGSGDWDLAVFRKVGGAAIAAGSSRGADEVAGGYGFFGEKLTVQACRRSGTGNAANLNVELIPIENGRPEISKLVNVIAPSRKERNRLNSLGLDVTEHGTSKTLGVVLHGADDEAKLRKAGFDFKVEIPDLVADSARARKADARFKTTASASKLPSGRTAYRRLADYTEELKKLAADNPTLVKPITLPFKTWEGRTVEGIEITENVSARDGKPVFLQMGVHHAREWPSGEHAMEWAYELINGYKSGDARTKKLVQNTRTIVVPIVNPDGFNASREAGELQGGGDGRGTPNAGETDETVNILTHPNEYRRKNCRFLDNSEGGSCVQPALGLASPGVDPNRNYGGFWGGVGASGDPTNETFYGPGPFSEPETKNVRSIVSSRQVTTLITNHTSSNLVLRPPGLAVQGETPDEPIYKALGESMTNENGYTNQFSYQLYDTTGTTEDWSYYATGGLGFTFEIGCITKLENGECQTGHFHPPFAEMVKEYDGETPFSDANGRDGKGNREAYYKAQEFTADQTKHAVIKGSGPPGAVLRLSKEFDTPTSQKNADGSVRTFKDKLDTTIQVPDSGNFEWHINQSTRPLVIKDKGRQPTAPPSAPQTFSGGVQGPPADGAAPGGDANTTNALFYNEHPFTVPADGDNAVATIRAEWATPVSDWDLKVYRDADGSGTVTAGDEVIGTSEQSTTDAEQATIANPVPGGKYVARMTNFAAAEPYEGTITFAGPEFTAAQKENWTLSCEVKEGSALTTQQLSIERGQEKTVDQAGCDKRATRLDRRERPALSQRIAFTSKGRYITAKVTGTVSKTADKDGLGPASSALRCAGTVTIRIKAGKYRIHAKKANVNKSCKFTRTIKMKRRSVPGTFLRQGKKLRLRSVGRYNGSRYLLPATQTKTARVKRR